MDYALINVPAAALRRKPDHRKEMVNQLLFGETVKVIRERKGLWVKVRSMHDDYEGWITLSQLTATGKEEAEQKSSFVVTGLLEEISFDQGSFHIPAGASLPMYDNGRGLLGKQVYRFSGFARNRYEHPASGQLILQLANAWLGVPYLWGGRSVLGVDCSGLVQVIFKQAGIDLPRDAWQQAQQGKPVKKLEDALPGDLAFFDNGESIVHTGILMGDGNIIHAQGSVRVDQITAKGIINRETGKRTARLRAIRRII